MEIEIKPSKVIDIERNIIYIEIIETEGARDRPT